MRAPDQQDKRSTRHSTVPQAALCFLSVMTLLFLSGCGGPASAWRAYPPVGAPDTIILSLAPDPSRPGWLFAGSSQGDIYHFSATGSQLPAPVSKLPAAGAVDTLVSDPANPSLLFASGTAGVFMSADSGAHWQRRDTGLPASDAALSLTWTSDGHTLLAGTGAHGVYSSDNEGATWTVASDGLPDNADVYTLYRAPGAKIILASVLEVGLYASLDNGAHWAVWPAILDAREIFSLLAASGPTSGNGASTLYAGSSKGLFVSVDGGQTWTQVGYGRGLPSGRVLSLAADVRSPGTLYAGTDQQVYRSTDGGVSWSALGPGIAHQVAALLVVQVAGQPSVIFAGAGDLYRFPRTLPQH